MLIFAQVCGCVLILALAAFLFFLAWSTVMARLDARRDHRWREALSHARLKAAADIEYHSWWFSEDTATMEGFVMAGEYLLGAKRIEDIREDWRKKRQAPKEQP